MSTAASGSAPNPPYAILVDNRALRDLDRVPDRDYRRLDTRIEALADNPRPFGVEKLAEGLYRIRSGDWRVIYGVDDGARRIIISRVKRRNERTYR